MGRNMADFKGITYNYTGTHPTSHELEAFDPSVNDVVGYMRWHKETGRIEDVSVDPEHRRKGIATGLWNHANTLDVTKPIHSGVRSEAANAWIESLKKK
jgi:GNAT superfamily N-acetyltransferase